MYKLEELFQPSALDYMRSGFPSATTHKFAIGEARVGHGNSAYLTELGEHVFIMAGCKTVFSPPYNCGIYVPDYLIRALTGGRDV